MFISHVALLLCAIFRDLTYHDIKSLDDRCAIFVGPYGGYLVDMQRSHPCQKDTSSKGDVREVGTYWRIV